jgi:hypothetical protein
MQISDIILLVFGIIILLLLPKVLKSLSFKNPISVDSFSNLKCKEKPELGVLFYWFGITPSFPPGFYKKCFKELYKLDKSRHPLSEEVYAFAFEKFTGYSPFQFRSWGWVVLTTTIILLIVFNLDYSCDKINCLNK